jgi:hypothetical protein
MEYIHQAGVSNHYRGTFTEVGTEIPTALTCCWPDVLSCAAVSHVSSEACVASAASMLWPDVWMRCPPSPPHTSSCGCHSSAPCCLVLALVIMTLWCWSCTHAQVLALAAAADSCCHEQLVVAPPIGILMLSRGWAYDASLVSLGTSSLAIHWHYATHTSATRVSDSTTRKQPAPPAPAPSYFLCWRLATKDCFKLATSICGSAISPWWP